MPSVPQGPIASRSSAAITWLISVMPPSKVVTTVRNTSTAATTMIAPWMKSVYTEAMIPSSWPILRIP